MRGQPHALKVFVLAGQSLALLFAIPMVFVGVQIYIRTAKILVGNLSLEEFCTSANPTSIILNALGQPDDVCMLVSENQNMTLLEEECGSAYIPKCNLVNFFEWIGFVIRPVKLGITVTNYFKHGRFVTLVAKNKSKTRIALGRVDLLDFVMFTVMYGDASGPWNFLATLSFISYLRFTSAFFIERLNNIFVFIVLGIAHCAACAEGLMIIGMMVFHMHGGVRSHKVILGVFRWHIYANLLAPLNMKFLLAQISSYGLLSCFHVVVMSDMVHPFYLLCVFGYPIATLLIAYLNVRSIRRSVLANNSFKGPRGAKLCSLVEALCDICSEDLLYSLTFERRTMIARMTNYDLIRLFQYSEDRVVWAPADHRATEIQADSRPLAVAYVDNGDVHVQLNDAALKSTEICFVEFMSPFIPNMSSKVEEV